MRSTIRLFIIGIWVVIFSGIMKGQNVGIGQPIPDPSAKLEIYDTTRGILIPRLTSAQRDMYIPTPATGLLIYNTTCNVFQYWDGTQWTSLIPSTKSVSFSGWCSVFLQWEYKLEITISNPTSTNLTDIQVPIYINTQSLISAGKMNVDGSDIRFTDNSCSNLPYYIESGINTTSTLIWVRIPLISANSSIVIYMFYGNPGATSASDPVATFHFWDDFNDLSKWSFLPGTAYTLSGSVLTITDNGYFYLNSILPFNINDGYIVEGRILYSDPATGTSYSGVLESNSAQQGGCGSNSCGEAVIHYMRAVNSRDVYWWIGSGATTTYNLGSGYCWTSADNTWYVIGYKVEPTRVTFYRDYNSECSSNPFAGWAKNLRWLIIGHFCCAMDIQDTSYDWVRIRKADPSVLSIAQGVETQNICN